MLTRRTVARETRREASEIGFLRPHPDHPTNGEEAAYTNPNPPPPPPPPAPIPSTLTYIANYSKGLPHNNVGEVDPAAYRAMLRALTSANPADFEQIPMGTPPPRQKLVNPQSGLAFDLEGSDAFAYFIPPAPRIDGPENSAEMAELYWMALLRDVSFTDFGTGAGTDAAGPNSSADAADALTDDFTAFRGPRDPTTGRVTPATLFRGFTPGDLLGPYVSQFLLKRIVFGTLRFNQRQRTAATNPAPGPGIDYLIDPAEWLAIQDGAQPAAQDQFDPTRRFIRNPRDLATYVHFDALYEAYLNACLILLDMRAPFDPGNPYTASANQLGFGTFGGPHILSLLTEVATRALKAVWYQKWFVHRRLRPEAFGGLVHHHLAPGAPAYPIDPEILDTNGTTLTRIRNRNAAAGANIYLLPQAFPEGSPLHPSYGAGHATVAGACVTILKAWFDESFRIPNPVVPNATGRQLIAYAGPGANELTVGGELNKVAANIAIGRNMAGVHWRSDYTQSMRLGEAVAISILEEQKLTYNEPGSFTVTKFDGTAVTI
jgi:membrane-associated phospholipid phosphatase